MLLPSTNTNDKKGPKDDSKAVKQLFTIVKDKNFITEENCIVLLLF